MDVFTLIGWCCPCAKKVVKHFEVDEMLMLTQSCMTVAHMWFDDHIVETDTTEDQSS